MPRKKVAEMPFAHGFLEAQGLSKWEEGAQKVGKKRNKRGD